jgi:thiol-disulfide isomerase/thioredoxin
MKKTFTIIFTLLTTFAFSQILYQNDFEAGIGDMTLIDNDGQTPAANVAEYAAAWTIANPTFGNGTNLAISNSWYSPAGTADDWMITPAINITGEKFFLKWEAKAQDASFPDGYQVLVSTTGNTIPDFTDVVFEIANEMPSFTERQVDLTPYNGQTIYIAFRNNSTDQFLLLVDNVLVESPFPFNVTFTANNIYRFQEMSAEVAVGGTVQNRGTETITSLDFSWTDGTNNNNETISGLNILPGETAEISHSTVATIAAPEDLNITMNVDNLNGNADEQPNDNGGALTLTGVMDPPAKQLFLEEATGTWCPWCPRGEVFMNKMEADYPENIALVAVHVGLDNTNPPWPDPMQVYEDGYGIAFASLFGGLPFPTLVVDRVANPGTPSLGDFDNTGIGDMDEFGITLVDFTNERPSPIGLDVQGAIDGATRMLTADLTVTTHSRMTGSNFAINVLVTEDHVTGPDPEYRQANNYAGGGVEPMEGYESLPNPVPGDQMEYSHTFRAGLNGGISGSTGLIPANIEPGQTYTETFTWAVPAGYDINEMNLIAVVFDMNNDGAAYNAKINRNLNVTSSIQDQLLDENVVNVYPNPFSDQTNIEINLAERSDVSIEVLDAMGKMVASRDYGSLTGNVNLPFMANDLSNGIYFIHVKVNDMISTEKVTIAR